jgi:hypothetical protein
VVALPLVPVRSLALVFILSIALTLISSAIPWLARQLRDWHLVIALVIGLVVGVTAGLVGAVAGLPLLPVTDLMVLVVAWSGGLLLGRGMPAHFRSFLLLFLGLSAVDILLAVGGYPQAPHGAANSSPLAYANFLLVLPWGRFAINVADLLLLAAVAEHWRRRGGGYLIALLPGALGFLLADVVILATGLVQLPGFPFFTAGYLCSEAAYRYISRHRAARPGMPAH